MPDETPESTQESTESKASPTPIISENSGGSQTSTPDFGQFIERLDRLEKAIPDMVGKAVQSTKDKRFTQLESLIGDFQTMSEYLKAANGDPAVAARNFKVDQLLSQPVSASPASAGNGSASGERRVSQDKSDALVAELGLEADDPVVQEWGNKKYRSEEHAELELRRMADKARRQAGASGTPVFDGQAHPAPASGNVEQLTNNLNRLMESGASSKDIADAHKKLQDAMSRK
jgi:hypothetical protein